MTKKVSLVDGFGLSEPREVVLRTNETVGELKTRVAKELNIKTKDISLTLDEELLGDGVVISKKVTKDKHVLFIVPRGGGGA
jgi:hypothetical protein